MQRYRVHIVPRTGRFAPLLTVLVEAESRDEAFQIAQIRCAASKVSPRRAWEPGRSLSPAPPVADSVPESVSSSHFGVASHA